MLILTSNGLSSKNLLTETKKYVNEAKKKAVIVTTASAQYKDKDCHIPRLIRELNLLGLNVDFLDIEFQSPQLLYKYDVIEILGGNPFFLLHQLNKKNCKSIFRDLIKKRIVIGISAGSIVFQKSIELVAQYSPEMNENIGLKDLAAMGLTDEEILPHYDRFIFRYERFEERAKEYEIAKNRKIIRINDGQGLFILNHKKYVI